MSKKNRQRRRADAVTKAPKKKQIPFVARPFEGLAGERELVANDVDPARRRHDRAAERRAQQRRRQARHPAAGTKGEKNGR